jgi:hypothetical protein
MKKKRKKPRVATILAIGGGVRAAVSVLNVVFFFGHNEDRIGYSLHGEI